MSKTKLTPLQDRVIVKRDNVETMSKGGIVLPNEAKDKPTFGTVIAVGPGKMLECGDLLVPSVSEGDRILFGKYSGTEVKIDLEEYLVIREEDIMALVN